MASREGGEHVPHTMERHGHGGISGAPRCLCGHWLNGVCTSYTPRTLIEQLDRAPATVAGAPLHEGPRVSLEITSMASGAILIS